MEYWKRDWKLSAITALKCALLTMFVWSTEVFAAKKSIFDLGHLDFQSVDIENHVSFNVIMSIEQDIMGFIWIGTQGGLIRYDGYQFKQYVHDSANPHSIPGNFINTLWASQENTLWIGTESDGLTEFNWHTGYFRHFTHKSHDDTSITANTVRKVIGDDQGHVFVGTARGLSLIDTKTWEVIRISEIDGCRSKLLTSDVKALLLDKEQSLWVGTKFGLCRINLVFPIENPKALSGEEISEFNNKQITELFLARDNSIWIGGADASISWYKNDNGVSRVGKVSGRQGITGNINGFVQPNDEEIWAVIRGGGVYVLDTKSGDVRHHIVNDPVIASSIKSNNLYSVFMSESGLIWLGSADGLNLYNPANKGIRTLRWSLTNQSYLSQSDTYAIYESGENEFWFGTSGGVDIVHTSLGRLDRLAPKAKAFAKDRDGGIWMGAPDGLHVHESDYIRSNQYTIQNGLSDNWVRALLYEVESNKLWIGTNFGLNLFDVESREFQSFEKIENSHFLSDKRIFSIVENDEQWIWFASNNGLFVLSKKQQRIWEISHAAATTDTLADNYISSLTFDIEGRLILTTGGGIQRLKSWDGKTAVFESLDVMSVKEPILTGNPMEDRFGRIWHYKGWLDPANQTWQELGPADGWDIGAIWYGSSYRASDGTMLFGGTGGVLMVRPERWQSWDYQPPLVISNLEVNNSSVSLSDNIVLKPGDSGFSLEFSSLDFTAPEKNLYAYKLEGYDKNWIATDASHRRATYTNLAPGTYRLRIKGTNRNGDWSRYQIELPIIQVADWYQTTWAQVAAILSFATFIYLLFYWRFERLKSQRKALNDLVKSRTRNISMLSVIGREITSTLNFDEVLGLVYKHVNQLMDANVFTIGILDGNEQRIECKLSIEEGYRQKRFYYDMKDTHRPAVWCVTNQTEIFVNNSKELQVCLGEQGKHKLIGKSESVLYLPLLVEDRVMGCITAQSYQKNAFDENDLEMLRTIANYTAIALDNAESHQRLESTLANLKTTQEQLINQEKMAGLGTMTAGLMHEINNPTNFTHASIYNLQEKLKEHFVFLHELAGGDNAPDEVLAIFKEKKLELNEIINTAQEGTKRIKKIISDLSSFSRNDTGEMQPANVLSMVDSAINLIKTEHKSVLFDLNNVDDVNILCFQSRISQVLMNILINACHAIYTRQEEEQDLVGKVTIATDITGEDIVITIADNGCGMNDKVMKKLFEPFYSTKDVGKGTGLGMAISYNIIEEHNGKIRVESTPGVGTVFNITLHRHDAYFWG